MMLHELTNKVLPFNYPETKRPTNKVTYCFFSEHVGEEVCEKEKKRIKCCRTTDPNFGGQKMNIVQQKHLLTDSSCNRVLLETVLHPFH